MSGEDVTYNITVACFGSPYGERWLCWTEDEAAQSERKANSFVFPNQSSVGEANRLQRYGENSDDEGIVSAWCNYDVGGERNLKLTSPHMRIRQNADVWTDGSTLAYPTLYASALITQYRI